MTTTTIIARLIATAGILLFYTISLVASFTLHHRVALSPRITALRMEEEPAILTTSTTAEAAADDEQRRQSKLRDRVTTTLLSPVTFNEMVKQAASAMTDAYSAGMNRQIVRVLLPRDPSGYQLGRYFESTSTATRDLLLVPPDESWQGGIMQVYRAIAPTCVEILRRFSRNVGGLPPKISEDRSVDPSGVDGVGLWVSQNSDPKDDISCMVQPTQETVDAITTLSKQAGNRLVLLLNPQWRNTDDALDNFSRKTGMFGSLAAFLGGKGESLRRLDELGYKNVFTIESYVCKGGNIRLIKRFDSNWAVFAENDAATTYINVGTSATRPTYQDVDKMLGDLGISLKYARDIGMAPKL